MDARSLELLKLIYPDIRTRVFRFREDVQKITGLTIRVSQGLRTMAEQAALYAQGRTAPGKIVTRARAGLSMHHYGLAFDICFVGQDPYLEAVLKTKGEQAYADLWRSVGKAGQGNGLTWGFDWNGNGVVDGNDFDRPHFQLLYGLQFHEIADSYKNGGLAGVWYSCDLRRNVTPMSEWRAETLPPKEEVV